MDRLRSVAWFLRPLAIIHHLGRKSRRRYRTPVVAFRTAEGFVIPMTYGRDVDWARNLVAAGGGELERLGQNFAVRNPRIVGDAVAGPRLPPVIGRALVAAKLPGFVLVDIAAG